MKREPRKVVLRMDSQYKVLYTSESPTDLEVQVERYLKLGYVCTGGISAVYIGNRIVFYQSVIKKG